MMPERKTDALDSMQGSVSSHQTALLKNDEDSDGVGEGSVVLSGGMYVTKRVRVSGSVVSRYYVGNSVTLDPVVDASIQLEPYSVVNVPVDPSVVAASVVVLMPSNPVDGQFHTVRKTDSGSTAVHVEAAPPNKVQNSPLVLGPGDTVKLLFNAASTTWLLDM